MIRISLFHGDEELKDRGYREQAVPLVVKKNYRWTWKPPFRRQTYSGNAKAKTAKDVVFGPFQEFACIDGVGVTIEGFERPIIVVPSRPYQVHAGENFTIGAGWQVEIT